MMTEKKVTASDLTEFRKRAIQDKQVGVLGEKIRREGLSGSIFRQQEEDREWFRFSHQLPLHGVSNQEKTGRCWIYAACSVLKTQFLKKYGPEEFSFSQNYIAFYDLLEKANYFLEMILATLKEETTGRLLAFKLAKPIQDAGQWAFFTALAGKYGIVPDYAMSPTPVDGQTGELTEVLSGMLRSDAFLLRRGFQQGERREELLVQKRRMLWEIYRVLVMSLGYPPETFDLELIGKDGQRIQVPGISPVAFYRNYVDEGYGKEYVTVVNIPSGNRPYYRTYTVPWVGSVWEGENVKYFNLPLDTFRNLAEMQMEDDIPVWFGCDSRMGVDREKGILHPNTYDFSQLGYEIGCVDKGKSLEYQIVVLNHAMVLQGFHRRPEGGTDRWLVENSYGPDVGHEGYLSLSAEWFDRYVYEAVIHKKYLTEELLKLYGKEPIVLEPWDPLGALAGKGRKLC